MDPRFLDYGTAVCAHVRHATEKERAAIRKELADHMEDHAQALMDGASRKITPSRRLWTPWVKPRQ